MNAKEKKPALTVPANIKGKNVQPRHENINVSTASPTTDTTSKKI